MLDLARGGQHVVGVERGIGDEQVVHDGEQVLAQEPLAESGPDSASTPSDWPPYTMSDRTGGCRSRLQRSLPRSRMFSTRTPGLYTSGINTRSMSSTANWSTWVDRARPPPRCLHAPLSTARHASVRNCIAPLRWCSRPISGRSSDGCVVAYSRANRSISSTGSPTVCDTCCRRVLPCAVRQRFVPDGVLRHVLVVHQAVANHHVHHRQRQRRIAGGLDLHVPVGGFRGARSDRIDDHDLGAAALRFAHQRPEVQVRDDRVRPPQHDEPAVDDLFRIDAGAATDRGRQPRGRHGAADLAIEAAAAHRPEQPPVERGRLNQPLHAGGAVRQDRLRARFRGNRAPP